MKVTRLMMVAFAVVLSLVAVSAPQAQEANCATCSYSGQTDQHNFSVSTCSGGGGCRDCNDAPTGHIGCHSPLADGECSPGHTTCDDEEPCPPTGCVPCGPQGCEEFLLAAIKAGDSRGIAKVLAAKPMKIQLNVERNAIQIRGCQNNIVSHIPMTKRLVASVRASRERYAVEAKPAN